ncbi:MAG: hypothetical protein ACKOFI_03885, partial [Phycisphaerales bacterium]
MAADRHAVGIHVRALRQFLDERRLVVDVRAADGKTELYGILWKPPGFDPATGSSRALITETQPSWQDNAPTIRFLE